LLAIPQHANKGGADIPGLTISISGRAHLVLLFALLTAVLETQIGVSVTK